MSTDFTNLSHILTLLCSHCGCDLSTSQSECCKASLLLFEEQYKEDMADLNNLPLPADFSDPECEACAIELLTGFKVEAHTCPVPIDVTYGDANDFDEPESHS